MRVAVIGANGQLGSDLVQRFRSRGEEVVELDHGAIRVEDAASVDEALEAARPDAVLNCAAFHHLGRCEEDPERTFAVNAVGALNVARTAAELGAANVYFSTDYVFDGTSSRPYREEDRPAPLNVYGASKVAGEHLTLSTWEGSCVVRISGIYGRVPCRAKGESFVTKMVRLAAEKPEVRVVDDEVLTPTPTRAIAEAIPALVASGARGIVHLTCEGECSWYEFAREIFATLKLATPLYRASVADFPGGPRRPAYSVLENGRLKEMGLAPMPGWRQGLRRFLEEHELTPPRPA